jgi:hypothetical protein
MKGDNHARSATDEVASLSRVKAKIMGENALHFFQGLI